MFYLDEDHEGNHWWMREFFEKRMPSKEYEVACYIMGVPRLFSEFRPEKHEYPFDWAIYDYIDNDDGPLKPIYSGAFHVLSSGERQLVLLGMNLYNSSNQEFNLCDAISTWSEGYYQVFQQVVSIRK